MKERELTICPLSAIDAEEIKKIERECGLSPWTIRDYLIESERKDSLSFVAKIQGKIIGFLISRLIIYEIEQLEEVEIFVFNIAVSKAYRRSGIGEALMKEIIYNSKNAKSDSISTSICLEVRESNKTAISFYQKLGFDVIGMRNNFYRNPVDNGLIMKTEI